VPTPTARVKRLDAGIEGRGFIRSSTGTVVQQKRHKTSRSAGLNILEAGPTARSGVLEPAASEQAEADR
jgi:hypothetical protein